MQNDAPMSPPSAPPNTPPNLVPPAKPKLWRNKWFVIVSAAVLLAVCAFSFWKWHQAKPTVTTGNSVSNTTQTSSTPNPNLPGLQLDPTKNYGNKYADGILPVGDGKYVTDVPKTGYIYVCSTYVHNLQTRAGGAGKRGPWFSADGTTYDINKKLHVQGSVSWTPDFSNTISGVTRTITTNDLPAHPTGIFPIRAGDPAYAYDKNPNTIKAQSLTFALTTGPTYSTTPNCMGGQSGVMLDGVALFNGFDAGGRDAGAWEVQDSCDGHPESQGEYHYHTLSSCIKDTSVKDVIGYALDGYPITGPKISSSNILTTADLDECH
ncbi:MAG TPA: YHYH protein, partial [Candidatus Saccharimonadales bacterium]|nr:YHYH protein [Candidatus Saccharimonadales bacterium]